MAEEETALREGRKIRGRGFIDYLFFLFFSFYFICKHRRGERRPHHGGTLGGSVVAGERVLLFVAMIYISRTQKMKQKLWMHTQSLWLHFQSGRMGQALEDPACGSLDARSATGISMPHSYISRPNQFFLLPRPFSFLVYFCSPSSGGTNTPSFSSISASSPL